ncbi:chromosome partitioning protein ParB [Nocardioides rubriscoriae]|uniref:chromosome partitioning protein ParB n=1 Tax=Nocardioides rubriscoriae TaxID=642762 RepID=UPI0011DF5515|nr:chromosome partitioning protein ParB [Nocardioides rubriscoriae]
MEKQRETHSRVVAGVREFWWTESLWAAAEGLSTVSVPIANIAEFDQNCWFGDTPPTCREVAEHARRIEAADLSHPIILNSSGGLMDGGHRIARAWLDGRMEVDAVQFDSDPAPDWTVPDLR